MDYHERWLVAPFVVHSDGVGAVVNLAGCVKGAAAEVDVVAVVAGAEFVAGVVVAGVVVAVVDGAANGGWTLAMPAVASV